MTGLALLGLGMFVYLAVQAPWAALLLVAGVTTGFITGKSAGPRNR